MTSMVGLIASIYKWNAWSLLVYSGIGNYEAKPMGQCWGIWFRLPRDMESYANHGVNLWTKQTLAYLTSRSKQLEMCNIVLN